MAAEGLTISRRLPFLTGTALFGVPSLACVAIIAFGCTSHTTESFASLLFVAFLVVVAFGPVNVLLGLLIRFSPLGPPWWIMVITGWMLSAVACGLLFQLCVAKLGSRYGYPTALVLLLVPLLPVTFFSAVMLATG
jgi:hypothetical protein